MSNRGEIVAPWTRTGTEGILDVSCSVSVPDGWLDINDHNKYELEKSTLSRRSVSHQRKTIRSEFSDGSWVVDAYRNNVNETVAVWVRGHQYADASRNLKDLENAFSQLYYKIDWVVSGDAHRWHCQVSDYSVSSTQPMLHANIFKLTARVVRHPDIESFRDTDNDYIGE